MTHIGRPQTRPAFFECGIRNSEFGKLLTSSGQGPGARNEIIVGRRDSFPGSLSPVPGSRSADPWPRAPDSATIIAVIEPKPVHILGLGNILMSDDGFGPYAARVLEATYELPEGVDVQDAGTPGLDLTPYVAGARAVIVIDTVTGDEAPGTLKTYDREQLLATPPPARTSPHQPGLREALMACELTDSSPDEILVVGVVPESIETGTGLSSAVRASVAPALKTVVKALERLGLVPRPRDEPLTPNIWWEP